MPNCISFNGLRKCILYLSIIVLVLLTKGCASKTSLYLAADELACHAGFEKKYIDTGKFELLTYNHISSEGTTLTVYIEGDGNAWRTRHQLSSDPTPRNPLALKLAVLDPTPNVVYLGRPCQYVLKANKGKNCTEDCWSTGRFSEDIVAALDLAISIMKEMSHAPKVSLIGYSGGGGLAVLVAARRHDVCNLRTIAANLDHQAFSRHHGITPLYNSLNPADVADQVRHIPQLHFVGGGDSIVPAMIAAQFIAQQSPDSCSALIEVPEADHAAGWLSLWPALLNEPFPCEKKNVPMPKNGKSGPSS